MQLVAYIGLKLKGIRGALVCFIGFGLPAFSYHVYFIRLIQTFQKHIGSWISINQLESYYGFYCCKRSLPLWQKEFPDRKWLDYCSYCRRFVLTRLHPALVLLFAGLLGFILSSKELRISEKSVKSKTFWFFLLALSLTGISILSLFILSKGYFTLATLMLRIDLFSFGGGLASMPIMYHELVDLYGWFDAHTFMDGAILGQ